MYGILGKNKKNMVLCTSRSGTLRGNVASRDLCPCLPRTTSSFSFTSRRFHVRYLNNIQRMHGFFNLFGGDKSSDDQEAFVETGPDRDWSNKGVDEVIITSWKDASGKEYDIVYRNGGIVDAASVEMLCDKINWPRRPQAKLDAALRNSFLVSSITLEEPGCLPEQRRLIGSARCTSDGAFNATIWDVMVDPEFQGLGLGKALLELMVRSLLQRDISNITLFADSQVVPFYKKLGFDADPEGIKGMFFRFGL